MNDRPIKKPFNKKIQGLMYQELINLPLQELVVSFHLCIPHKEVSMLSSFLRSKLNMSTSFLGNNTSTVLSTSLCK